MLLFSVAMLYISEKFKENKYIRIGAFILAGLSFFIVSAIRYDLGTDYMKRYATDYYRTSIGSDVGNLEWGFKLLMKMCLLYSQDYVAIIVATSAIVVGLTFYTIYKESPYPILSVLIYFMMGYFFHSLNLTREFVAVSILLCSYKFLIDKKYLYFSIAVVIAFFIHQSSIVILIAFLLCDREVFDLKRTIIISVLVFVLGKYLWPFIVDNVISNTRFSVYIGSEFDYGQVRKYDIIFNFILYCIIYYLYKNSPEKGRHEKFFLNMQAMSLIGMVSASVMYLFFRISFYFGIFGIISIPYFLKKANVDKKKKIIILIITMLVLGANITRANIIKNTDGVMPYKTIFSVENRYETDVEKIRKKLRL